MADPEPEEPDYEDLGYPETYAQYGNPDDAYDWARPLPGVIMAAMRIMNNAASTQKG